MRKCLFIIYGMASRMSTGESNPDRKICGAAHSLREFLLMFNIRKHRACS